MIQAGTISTGSGRTVSVVGAYWISSISAFGARIESAPNTWEIAENVYESKTFPRMKLLGLVLSTIEVSEDGLLSWVTVKEDYYRQTGTSAEDTDGFINYPRAVKGVEVAVLFREAGDKVKISFRSKGRVDVSQLAQSLGGGGHPNAAGAVISDNLDGTKADVLPKAKELVRNVITAGAI